MNVIRALIVDDERLARASIRVLLERDHDIEVIGECDSGTEAVRTILAQDPDLVFLDIEMPQMNGFDILGAVGHSRRFAVVFVTAHDTYAVEAFDAQARDYVLKPFDDRRFARALVRAKAEIRRARLETLAAEMATVVPAPTPSATSTDRIEVRDGGKVSFIAVGDIDWIEADDYYVQLHVGAKAYHLRESMRDLERRLDPDLFLRIHRSAIVAIARVAELRPIANGDYSVRLSTGAELKLSRGRRDRLRALVAGTR
jgi:two-component system, LytTR family, response regulator